MDNFLDPVFLLEIFEHLIKYVPITLGLAVGTMIMSCLLALMVTILRYKKVPILGKIGDIYVLLGRALPSMILIYLAFFGIPVLLMAVSGTNKSAMLLSGIPPIAFAALGLTLHTGAYLAEIFRGALQSVNVGQTEAELSIGMTWNQAFFRIILPQAAVFATPMMANQFLNLLKGTSIAFMISVIELFGAANVLASNNNAYLEVYIVTACLYWSTSICFEKLASVLEYNLSYFKRCTSK
ncbi:MAG: amino acid ABC transporter permease [Acholeplasmataceae bacterium]|nr:amino acid ABC transporter permease [Acholeplasmataceae bacterium]